MTASDARPPSDTGARVCIHARVVAVLVGIGPSGDDVIWLCANSDCKQRFVPLDPAEARDTIARALEGHEGIRWVKKSGGWDCWCGHELTARWAPALSVDATGPWRAHIADMLAGVLAGQGQP